MIRSSTICMVTILALISCQQIDSFSTVRWTRRSVCNNFHSNNNNIPSALFAKSKPSKNAASGFGGVSTTTTKIPDNKLRSMSGFQGAGTKPLRVAANTFDKLRQRYGIPACSDVYVRSRDNDPHTFWFVGKVARCTTTSDALHGTSIPTPQEAVISQKRLILEYAKRELRPQNLGGTFSQSLDIWLAPGDSEMECVQNKIALEPVTGSAANLSPGFSVADVGYNPEIYLGDELSQGGLRLTRDIDGRPIKPVFDVKEAVPKPNSS